MGKHFKVSIKPNQKLKYLNLGSKHTDYCFRTIASGVFSQPSTLTSVSPKTMNPILDILYHNHAKPIHNAGSVLNMFPKMKEFLEYITTKNNNEEKKKKNMWKALR